MVDLSKIKVGDEVTVRAKVVALEPNKWCLEPIRLYGGSWIHRDNILAHTPAPREFKPGDKVIITGGGRQWVGEFAVQRNGSAIVWVEGRWKNPDVSQLRHADESDGR